MKRLGITFILCLTLQSGFSQSSILDRVISIRFDSIRIVEALKLLEREKGIPLAYSTDIPALNEIVSFQFDRVPLKKVLNDICASHDLGYKLIGNTVTFYPAGRSGPNEFTVSGFIFDSVTGEVLISCSVYNKTSGRGTASNHYGFFSLTLPAGKKKISFSYVGYENKELTIQSDTTLSILLSPVSGKLHEIIVLEQPENEIINTSNQGSFEIKSKYIKNITSTAGEVDVLKTITLLPGVMPGVDGSAAYYVRGGNADQNLMLLDGIPIYNPFHLWGFLSSFNANAINHIKLIKGAFPARYGGRLSSVLDIIMNDGNMKKWSADFAIGILSVNATVSGPLKKDRSSLMFSARRTYADLFYIPIYTTLNSTANTYNSQGYSFTDLNLKWNYRLSDKNRFYISGFYSRDKFFKKENAATKWGQTDYNEKIKKKQGWGDVIGSFRWNHLYSNKIFSNTTFYFSYYNFTNKENYERTRTDEQEIDNKISENTYLSNIRDIALTQDYESFAHDHHHLRFGAGYIFHTFKPGVNSFFSRTGEDNISNNIDNNLIRASELSGYFEDDMKLGLRFLANAGIHVSGFFVGNSSYYSIEPRLSLRYIISGKISLKAGYTHMTQYLHFLTNSGIVQSSDLWVPTTDKIKPETSRQGNLGITIIAKNNFELEVDGYYKTLNDLIQYKEGASYLYGDAGWEEKVTSGTGESYGIEWFLKKNQGRLTGWVGYTLSWSNRQFAAINSGEVFPYRYDRRHDISIVGNYRLSERWSLNGTWVFYTGNAVTVPVIAQRDPYFDGSFHSWNSFPSPNAVIISDIASSGIIDLSPEHNNYRMPNYHRLDVTASYLKHKRWGWWELTFGVTNLYNRMNPSYYTKSYEQDEETGQIKFKYKQITLFPIMPSIYYRISF